MSIFDSSTPVPSGQKVPCEVGKTVVNSPVLQGTAATLAELAQYISPGYQLNMNGQTVRGARVVAPKTPLMGYCPECGELADFSDALMPEWAMYQCPECFMDFHVSELEPLTARPQQVQLAQAARTLPPVVTGDAAQDADYVRVRAAREAGCTRVCGNMPNLPVCTKCFVNAHKGKYNPQFHGYENWLEVFEGMSVVHGWIKPSGVA